MPRILETLAGFWPGRARPPAAASAVADEAKASATGPLIVLETLGRPVWTPRDYEAFAREGFMQNAIVYRAVRMISEAAASVPLLLYEGDAEIDEHPLLDLLARPSLDHTGADFLEAWYGYLLVSGNGYVEAVAVDGKLRELHALRPDRMKVVPGAEGWPEAYEYTCAGRTLRFDDEAVDGVRPILHVRLFHPVNDHYGMSPVEAAAQAIDIHNTAGRWNKALLDNSARPSGALVYGGADGRMTAEQFERLKAELEDGFQGPRRAGRPLLLEGGLDWKPLSLSPKDMDFIAARNGAAREIALAFGVPPMLLGIPGDNTYPVFPYNLEIWSDGENWHYGHWLNGRFSVGALAEVVDAILADYGFDAHDASRLAGIVPGYVIDRLMSPRDALQPLELAYFFDSFESDGLIRFRHRGAEPPVMTLGEEDLVEERPGEALLTLTRAQETDLPASAKVSHIAAAGDYRQAIAEARRLTGGSGRVARAELPIVLEHDSASRIADAWLFETWAARERAALRLPPSAIGVEPGDVLAVDRDGHSVLVRVTEIGERGLREVEGLSIDPDVYWGGVPRDRETAVEGIVFDGTPYVEFLDLPLLRGDEPPEDGYVAAYQLPWPGSVALLSSPEDAGYVLRAEVRAPAVMGVTLDPLPPGPLGVFDRATRLRVAVGGGELASVTRLQLLSGANAAAVKNEQGGWEVLQFQTATLVSAGTYLLSGLLRGQGGTERERRAPLASGATFVLLSGTARVSLAPGEIGLPLFWRFGPSNRDIADRSYATETHAFRGRGLKPLSPVHVRGARTDGDLTLNWVRRTRVGGDGWDAAEVPLGEEAERYEVDVLDGDEVKRTILCAAPHCVYTAAEQAADFGALQSTVDVAIHQMSAAVGRGTPKRAIV